MGRLLAGLALVALCAGLVWLWSGSERGASARTARTGSPAESSPTRAAELARAARPEESGSGELGAVAPPAETRKAPAAREELARTAKRPEARATDLVVEVVDPTGAPRAGIPLQVGLSQPGNGGGWTKVQEHGTLEFSDPEGRVVFVGLRARIASEGSSLLLCADVPFEEAPILRLDATVLAAPVVRFELPPGGILAVAVRELDGARAPDGSKLRLQLLKPEELLEPDLSGPQWTWPLVEGAFHIPWIELGRDWELAAWRPNGAEPTRLRTRGPERLGERVERELVLGSDHPVVSFRVLAPDGRALARAEVELARSSIFGSIDRSTLTTDADGRFTLDGQVTLFESGGFALTYAPPGGEVWIGRAGMPGELASGWNDGGDIRLELEPLLVAGSVVDGRGVPVVGAEVIVGTEQRWVFGEAKTMHGKSDALGNFELRGLWTEDTFPIHALAAGHRSQDHEARQGERGVVLVLTPRFVLSGELALDDGIDPGVIHFARESADGARVDLARPNRQLFFADPFTGAPANAGNPGSFTLEPIEGGVFDFLCLLENVEVARIAGLAVHSDLDLGVIDLRGKIAACEIELVGDGDLSALTGEYSWRPSADGEHRQGSFQGPLVRILSARVPLDVELRPRGYRSALLEKVEGKCEHRLEAPMHVRLVLRTNGSVPPPPYRFDCELFQGGTAMSQPDGPRWFTPERNEIRCLVASAGKLEVRWHLERKVEGDDFGGAVGSHVLEEHWTSIEVLDVPGEQVFEVVLDATALEELVRDPPF